MAFQLFNTALLAALELSVNNILKLDQAALKKIQALTGSVLVIKVAQPELSVNITFHQQGIHLSSYFEGEGDCTISGPASALFQLLLPNNKQAFYSSELDINGDVELVQTVHAIASGLNIDWEFYLSKIVGDIPTQTFSDNLQTAKTFAEKTHQSLVMDLEEYIHEEKNLLPGKRELERFYRGLDELTLSIDRAHARLKNIVVSD